MEVSVRALIDHFLRDELKELFGWRRARIMVTLLKIVEFLVHYRGNHAAVPRSFLVKLFNAHDLFLLSGDLM